MERFRSSMKNKYYCIWKSFNKFFIKLDVKSNNSEDRLTLFVGYMIQSKKQPSTIKSYISTIKAVLLNIGIELNEDRYLLASLTHACKLNNDRICTKLPIQRQLLQLILDRCQDTMLKCNQPYLAVLYRALFTTAYYGMMRIGEVTTGDHPVKAVDVHVGSNKKKLLFILRTSKTHGLGDKPQKIKIMATELSDITTKKNTSK